MELIFSLLEDLGSILIPSLMQYSERKPPRPGIIASKKSAVLVPTPRGEEREAAAVNSCS